jgi:hypothetical protein
VEVLLVKSPQTNRVKAKTVDKAKGVYKVDSSGMEFRKLFQFNEAASKSPSTKLSPQKVPPETVKEVMNGSEAESYELPSGQVS